MIKLIALITMLIDHVSRAFLLNSLSRSVVYVGFLANLIGRFAMPFFAFCIARSFDHYSKNGNVKKYFRNIAVFALISQYPFWLFCEVCVNQDKQVDFFNFMNVVINSKYGLNIGFTWLCSLVLLWAVDNLNLNLNKHNLFRILCVIAIILVSIFVNMDYGIYGVLLVFGFYLCWFKFNNLFMLLLFNLLNYAVYCLQNKGILFYCDAQSILVVFAVFFVIYLQKTNLYFRLPKGIFYVFYPLHFLLMVLIKYGFLYNVF